MLSVCRILLVTVLLCLVSDASSFGCDCGTPGPASGYITHATVVFVGKVVFTDDDGSGKFAQHTLVRFDVEESFKGLKSGVRDVWIDPGSCTSCYAEYKVGERYLVFAYGGTILPKEPPISKSKGGCKSKPLPKAIDAKNPPTVYLAPECSGNRQIMPESESVIAQDIGWLRNYKAKSEKDAAQK